MATNTTQSSLNMRLFADLVRCETRLYNALDDELRERHGIVTSQFEFLLYLRVHRQPRVADLATEFAVGVGAVSKSIDRLEQRGLVTRRPNPNDRRSTILALTEEGRGLIDAARITFEARLDQIFGVGCAPEQIVAAAAVLAALRATLERENLGTPTG